VAHQPRGGRGFDTVAGHVADNEQPLTIVERYHVIEVAADLQALTGRFVPRPELEPGDRRQRRREQRGL
jgi:hypothetical protein